RSLALPNTAFPGILSTAARGAATPGIRAARTTPYAALARSRSPLHTLTMLCLAGLGVCLMACCVLPLVLGLGRQKPSGFAAKTSPEPKTRTVSGQQTSAPEEKKGAAPIVEPPPALDLEELARQQEREAAKAKGSQKDQLAKVDTAQV